MYNYYMLQTYVYYKTRLNITRYNSKDISDMRIYLRKAFSDILYIKLLWYEQHINSYF